MHARYLALLIPLSQLACSVEFGGTPTPPLYATPTGGLGSDPEGDNDLQILSVVPADGATYLPTAFTITATFSEPFLGEDGDILARFGQTCDSGIYLRPMFNTDRSQVSWTVAASPGTQWCFDLNVLTNLSGDSPHHQAEWQTAPCGVSFDGGRGARFLSVAGDTSVAAPLNQALEGYTFPVLLSFAEVERDATFPLSSDVAVGRILQVSELLPAGDPNTTNDDEVSPTGQWSLDPQVGATDVLTGCDIDRERQTDPWRFSCSAREMSLPISLSTGAVLTDGTLLTYGEVEEIRLVGPSLQGTVADSGAFQVMSDLSVTAAVAEEDLRALVSMSGDGSLGGEIDRLTKDADTNNDGTNDGYSVEMVSSPVWVSLYGCDAAVY